MQHHLLQGQQSPCHAPGSPVEAPLIQTNPLTALSCLVQKQLKAPSQNCYLQATLLVTRWINYWS